MGKNEHEKNGVRYIFLKSFFSPIIYDIWQDIANANGGFLDGSAIKNPPSNAGHAGDVGLTPESGRFSGVGNGNPLQYSCLGNPVNRGACWTIVHGVTVNRTQLSN